MLLLITACVYLHLSVAWYTEAKPTISNWGELNVRIALKLLFHGLKVDTGGMMDN